VPVQFPLADGARSTSALGRAVVSAALATADPVGARAAVEETNWRAGYLTHFRRLVEAGLLSAEAARSIAEAGLGEVAARMTWSDGSAEEVPLRSLQPADGGDLETVQVTGSDTPATGLALPWKGELLTGPALHRRVGTWAHDGVVEPSVARSVRTVADHPEWLSLPGHTLVALGAAAEIGPVGTLLGWGARVAAVDLPRQAVWRRLLTSAADSAGTLLAPAVRGDSPYPDRAGADLLVELPALAAWVSELPGTLVLGNYVYADGGGLVRTTAAADHLATLVRSERPDLISAFLATPTDVFAVPGEAVAASVAAYERRSPLVRNAGRGLRTLSAGRLLQRNYRPGADPGVNDALVPQQGPNYALAKRLQRWRATSERAAGRRVSLNVAPPTRTRSVLTNRALAAAYAGAHRFGVEVFDPETTRVLMAALLVHDLHADPPATEHPWQDEAHQSAHGGLWRAAYAPRSALGLAALLGWTAAR
jgi:hypothetical protein